MKDPHKAVYEVRDPVHGFVRLTKAEREITDCPTFQRLRDIKQLAVAHYVYPGALHTRFEHSIGCVHVSDLALKHMLANETRDGAASFAESFSMSDCDVERARGILRLAALLHDVGHPPFSHSGEHLLPERRAVLETLVRYGWKNAGDEPQERVTHEDMTSLLIKNTEIGEIINKHYHSRGITVDDVIAVAVKPRAAFASERPSPVLWLLNEILTSDFGTDRIDYLLRDAVHSGQQSGVFDYRRLLDSMMLIEAPEDTQAERPGVRLGFAEGGWLTAEQMIVARYLMYISLYFHKTKRIYEQHMERVFPVWVRDRFGTDSLPVDVSQYCGMSESEVVAFCLKAGRDSTHPVHRHAKPFVDRTHFRVAKQIVAAENKVSSVVRVLDATGGCVSQFTPTQSSRMDTARLDKFAGWVRMTFGDNAILDLADHSATKAFSAGGDILVMVDSKPRYLGEVSEIVGGIMRRIWRCRVYSPKELIGDVRERCSQWLQSNPVEEMAKDVREIPKS